MVSSFNAFLTPKIFISKSKVAYNVNLKFLNQFFPGALTGSDQNLLNTRMEDLLFGLKAFIFSEIFHHASSNLDIFQIENTQSSSLRDALDKISIENGASSFSEEIFSQLEAEKDEITPIELMVFLFYFKFYLL